MCAHQDIVEDAEIGEDAAMLERARHAEGGQPVGRQPGDVAPLEADGARIGFVQAGHEIEQRRLSRAIGTDDADQLGVAHVQIDAIDGRQSPESTGQSADFKQRRHRAPSWRCAPPSPLSCWGDRSRLRIGQDFSTAAVKAAICASDAGEESRTV